MPASHVTILASDCNNYTQSGLQILPSVLPWKLLYAHVIFLSLAEWLACWTQLQKGPGSNRSHLGKLFTSIVPVFTKQQNWEQPS